MVSITTGVTGAQARHSPRGRLPPQGRNRRATESIADWVSRRPDCVALRFVSAQGMSVLTYRQLWERVCHIRDGAFAGLPPGSRVVMAQAGDADYVAGFVAAIEAGLIPVPLFLPTVDAPERFARRARHILDDCTPAAVFTGADLVDVLGRDGLLTGIALLDPDSAPGAISSSVTAVADTDRIAFLQYSSGSTGDPKGIVNTHESMLRQLDIAMQVWSRPDDVNTVSWLPLYHDLGIFWGVLLALATGGTANVISPFEFVRNPRIWLQTVDKVRGNWIAGPDFGYRLCIDAFDDTASAALDLSCLALATNGAEPVRPSTLRDFPAKFGVAGLRADVMTPQYGLAEAGLAVSGTSRPRAWVQTTFDSEELNRGRAVRLRTPPQGQAPVARSRTLVSCGDSTFGWQVRIVDAERRNVLADGEVGEIWVGGPGLPQGYWGRAEDTAHSFRATTVDGAAQYLRTGDAGFFSDGELYICGRYRDLIIVAGGNYFPNDIELSVEESGCGIDRGGACAVQLDDGVVSGEWWLIAETSAPVDDLGDISRILLRRILAAHQIAPERIVWVRPRVLPRTTSGKIRRRKALSTLVAGAFEIVHEFCARPQPVSADTGHRTELAVFIAGVLGVDVGDLTADADLVELGLTSVMTAHVVEWSAARHRRLDFADLYREPTLGHWQYLVDTASPNTPTGTATTFSGAFELTALQRAYWVGRGCDQPLGGVGCQTYFELCGASIEPARLDAALDALARRHPLLRSRFPDARQCRVAPVSVRPAVPVRQLVVSDAVERKRILDGIRNRLRTHRFDIENGDTWCVELSVLPDGCILHIAIDLIIADLASIGVFVRDLAALYRGDVLAPVSVAPPAGRPPAPLPSDVDVLPECPQLPRTEEREIVFCREQHTFDAAVTAGLDAMCRAHGVTRATVFLAAYTAVLGQWSTTADFLVNVTTFGRPPGVSDVIGDFTATRLHRAGVAGASGFAEYARGTQHALRAALSAPETSELLAAQIHCGTGHSGLAPVVFTYAADTPVLSPRDAETLGTVGVVYSMTPQVLIDNQIGSLDGTVVMSWDYRKSCFPPGVVADMFGAYVRLLRSLGSSDWSAPAIIDLPEHSALARRGRNATDGPQPVGLLHDGFRDRARRDPDRVALRWAAADFDDKAHCDAIASRHARLCYGELDDYALRVATALADRYRRGSIIAIQLPKGPAQVVAVLGVLMAGCTYLPVGIDQPDARLESICSLSGTVALIRSTSVAAEPISDGLPIHHIEGLLRGVAGEPIRADPQAAAYVIYTSGSTGEPKGVLVSHAAALNTVADVNRRNRIGETDVLLAIAALDFDLSVYDIVGPLSCGAAVVMIAEHSRRDPFRWLELISEFGVTVWDSVPPLMDMLLIATGGRSASLPTLRVVLLSGEWIPLDMPARVHSAAPAARLAAMGGATEAAIWSNEFVVIDVDPGWASVPYGYPLCNQRFRVVDDAGRDRPDHVAGELWIGGAGVALGYHNAADLTAERFVLDYTGQRWYRTGDLGCYWPDGTLQFLGRIDSQVKVGGHRVECGEVEHILRRHHGIDSAAVVPTPGNTALGAVVVPTLDAGDFTASAAEEVRNFVSRRLPYYMVPRWIVVSPALPLTGNGKIDRRAVARTVEAHSRAAAGPRSAEALSPTEQLVADVWSEVLGVPITRRDDNFFRHGGDSLRATQVALALRRHGVGTAVVGELLGRPTVGEFSAVCVTGPPAPDDADTAVDSTVFPLTRLQQAYALGIAGLNGIPSAPTLFTVVLAVDDPAEAINLDRFTAVVDRCVAEFDVLRCALDGDAAQRVHRDAPTGAVIVVDSDDPDVLMRQMAATSFDPRAVPALRCWALAGSPRYVGLAVNYLNLDARSLAGVIATIIADYRQQPRPLRIDPSADVFARYAHERGRSATQYRRDTAPPPALPGMGHRADAVTRVRFARSSFTLEDATFAGLREQASSQCSTPAALILEALADALHSCGAGDQFAIVVPKSHRPDFAPADREVLGNFTRLALCDIDYTTTRPGSPDAVAAVQRQLWRAIGDEADATADLAALQLAQSRSYPVVFTSTLGLVPQGPARMSNVRALTQTPGVLLDCQVEDYHGGVRISWDTASAMLSGPAMAGAFARFEAAVRRYSGQAVADHHLTGPGWAAAVIGTAASLVDPEQLRPEYATLLQLWRSQGHAGGGHDVTRAARRLADIVVGAASPQTLVGDPHLAPEAMLLADTRLRTALDDLGERVFGHARTLGRRLRIVEVGSRTGLITERLIEMLGVVVDDFVCYEPNPVLAQMAASRRDARATRPIATPAQLAGTRADVVICCGSLHQVPEPGAVLEALEVADDGWLWVAEICDLTAATLAGAAVLNPALLSAGSLPAADQWWRLIAQHGWQPQQMGQDGPGLTLLARRNSVSAPAVIVENSCATEESAPRVADPSVVATIAAIWKRHLQVAEPDLAADFFLLGGDSLAATRVYADLRAAGLTRLTLVDLFNFPVLGELAAQAGSPTAPPTESAAPLAPPAGEIGEFPLTAVQRAYLAGRTGGFMLSGVAAHCYFEFEADGIDRARFDAAARQLVERHPSLRTTVAVPQLRGVVHPEPIEPVVSEHDDVRAQMCDQVIDITTRPGIAFGVQQYGNGRAVVGISMDNVMLDGASMMLALAQLDYLYRGGHPDLLPGLPTTFAHYVHSRPELTPDADESALPQLAASRDYWRSRLASLPTAPQLAPMATILDVATPVFQRVDTVVAQHDWSAISQACRIERVTAAAFLMAHYARALARWSATTRFCVNVTLFDRDAGIDGIEQVIGDFTSLLLLECDVDETVSIWEQARRLQRQIATDLPHRAADAVWLQRELLRHHGRPADAVFPVVFTSGLGLIDSSAGPVSELGAPVFGLSQTPQTLLDFQMWERGGTLRLSWDFVTQVIPPSTARRNLDRMVEAMVADGDAHRTGNTPPPAVGGDDVTRRVAQICAEALQLSRIDLHDNFFQLGGDSVSATRVVEQINREVAANATLRLLFENPVVADFAAGLAAGVDHIGDAVEEGVL